MYQTALTPRQSLVSDMVSNNCMWAVPCFVMVTGALLLDPQREISLKKLYGKYILRMVYALVLCVFLFRFIDAWMDREAFSWSLFQEAFFELIQAASWSHLWYIYLLIGLYMILPVFKAVTRSCDPQQIRYILLILFLFQSVLPFLNGMHWNIGFYIHFSTIYPFYLLLGHALHKKLIHLPRMYYGIGICLSVLALAGCTLLTHNGIAFASLLTGYSSVLVVVQSLCVFGWFQGCRMPKENIQGWLEHFDSHSFGIYLFHLIFIRWLLKKAGFNPYMYGIFGFIGMICFVGILSYILAALLKRVPGIRRIV